MSEYTIADNYTVIEEGDIWFMSTPGSPSGADYIIVKITPETITVGLRGLDNTSRGLFKYAKSSIILIEKTRGST